MAEVAAGAVPFQEAISFYKDKVDLPTRSWTDLWQGQHARAFVVAGAVQADLVADFHDAVDRAIASGRTLADFRKDFDAIVLKHGWSYHGSRNWRSRVIYNTNVRMAAAAGRWAQIQEGKKRRPYLAYVAVRDSKTRNEHRDWDGTVLPVDDPWWSTHYPPNGWECRCSVRSLSERDLTRYGYEVSSEAPAVEMETRPLKTPDGTVTVDVPKGIDTGFGYNVGVAGFGRGADLVAMERHGPWEALVAPGGNRPREPGALKAVAPSAASGTRVRGRDEAGLRQALRDALGGQDEAVFVDPTGARVSIGQALVDHMIELPSRLDGREELFPLLPEIIANPAEIWVGWAKSGASGRVSLRRRYVRLFQLEKTKSVGLVSDLDNGRFSGLTVYRGGVSGLNALRTGLRIYAESQ